MTQVVYSVLWTLLDRRVIPIGHRVHSLSMAEKRRLAMIRDTDLELNTIIEVTYDGYGRMKSVFLHEYDGEKRTGLYNVPFGTAEKQGFPMRLPINPVTGKPQRI